MASFQTDESRSGWGDRACDLKTVLSSDGGQTWDRLSAPFALRSGTANWGSLFVRDDRTVIAAASITEARTASIQLRMGRIVREDKADP